MGSKILSYGEAAIIKSVFHKETTSININKIEINRIVSFDKTSYGYNGYLSTTLDIDTLMESFNH